MNIPSFYPVLVFVHVLSGVGIFVALGIEAAAFDRLTGAQRAAEAGPWMGLLRRNGWFAPLSMLLALAAGVWMMVVQWGSQPWIQASFAGLVAMGALGGAVTSSRMRRLGMMLRTESGPELSGEFRALRDGRALRASLRLRLAIGIGILALMTVKPDLVGSWLVLGAAIVTGLATTFSFGAHQDAPSVAPPAGAVSAPMGTSRPG